MPKLLLPVTHFTQVQRADCVAACAKSELPYWHERGGHAVVVIGIDDDSIYLNDPSFPQSPQVVSHGDFLLAWLEADEYYAIIRKP